MKILYMGVLILLLAGCVPGVKVKKDANIDRYEKNIEIKVNDVLLQNLMQIKFLEEGWNVVVEKGEENPRYDLACKAEKNNKEKYNTTCVLIDNKRNWKVADIETILFINNAEQNIQKIYEGVNSDIKEKTPPSKGQ